MMMMEYYCNVAKHVSFRPINFVPVCRGVQLSVGGIFSSGKQSPTLQLSEVKQRLIDLTDTVQPNGVRATPEQRKKLDLACRDLEALNPTKDPANSDKMTGFWRLLYSDFAEKGSSGGKLGPFVADVFQDLDLNRGFIVNSLKLGFPPISGGLKAKKTVKDGNTWQIEFEKAANDIFGLRFQSKKFPPGEFIRLWKITYLDDDFRIMRARRPETREEDAYIFILKRDDGSRFDVNFQ
eukprot:gene36228-43945_t